MSLNLIPHAVDPLSELLTRAAFAPLTNTGWIRVTGEDRVRWLNGMVTNSIQDLKPGDGCYNFFLSAQGRIQGDCTAWMQGDSILLETGADQVPALMALLERFIIMDDVELGMSWVTRGACWWQVPGRANCCASFIPICRRATRSSSIQITRMIWTSSST